jgi:isopentenyl-diphosphate delta-isomerase
MSTGLDVARSIALGASAAGIARPVLKALLSGEGAAGRAAAVGLLDAAESELRAVMLLTGSRTLAALRRAPRVISGELRLWLDELGALQRW